MTTPAEKPVPDVPDDAPFWRRKAMSEMTKAEWESLCDGCRLLDAHACRCTDYANRSDKVKDCVTLSPRNINRISWLPPTCGYVLVAKGKDLYWWHPLVSGDPETVHQAGVSVRGKVGASEVHVKDKDLEDHIVSWPLRWPKGAKGEAPSPKERTKDR